MTTGSSLAPSRNGLFAATSELPPEHRSRVRHMAALIGSASRPAREAARQMLTAAPEPTDANETRARIETVIAYLEARQASGPDEQAGMDWWNAQTDVARQFWLEQAEASALPCSAAGAWTLFKRQRGRKAVRS